MKHPRPFVNIKINFLFIQTMSSFFKVTMFFFVHYCVSLQFQAASVIEAFL